MPRIRTYIAGRNRGCDVPLDDSSVSSRHAEVVRLPGGRLYVTDRVTTNGTFILDGDQWRAIRQAFLEPDGRIRFGKLEMSARRLDDLCARVDGHPRRPRWKRDESRPKDDRLDTSRGLVRDTKTGEIRPR